MLDFLNISSRSTRSGLEISPKFIIGRGSKDLMIRGGDFYAVWDEERMMWSTNEDDVVRLVDTALNNYLENRNGHDEGTTTVKFMWDSDSGSIDRWHKYCQKQSRDSYKMLDEELIFSNTELKRENYASKRLNYPLEEGSIEAYDKLIGTLYSPEERHKLEWAIGSIVSGDSKTIQKFMVLYGAAGTGKSTILNIIQQLFEGYYAVFDAKSLGSANSSFALEPFKTNPLVAIQHDGDLSRIEDNTRLNSLVSHEQMVVNEKFKSSYTNDFKAFLFMGTNKPVKITDAKSGLIRRLIDVTPSGRKVAKREYNALMKRIPFELGAIAWHCLQVYKEDPGYYDDYVPISMIDATNDFHNFILDSYKVFKREDSTTLNIAWEMYNTYCEDAKVKWTLSKRPFQEELKNYFKNYEYQREADDGTIIYNYYSGFDTRLIEDERPAKKEKPVTEPKVFDTWLKFKCTVSIFDKIFADCFAQYANSEGTPTSKWENVKTKLSQLDTSKVHYARVPENHIVIDFDIKDENGNKSFEKNLEAASKWPATYAELSKSGGGIHLHYYYTGDVTNLSRIFDEDIEVKVFNGNSSLRRRLSKCNDLPIATLSSGLPLKGGKAVINFEGLKNEKMLRNIIQKHLNKEIMGATKPSVDMIYKLLEEAYDSGMHYDVSDMKNEILAFAVGSSNQAATCLKIVGNMKFMSEEASDTVNASGDETLVFYDVEVFPNLFLVCWQVDRDDAPIIKMINPKPQDIEQLIRHKLVGFNNRSYDNHMLYGCMMGYSNEQLYNLSQRLISKDKQISRKAKFGEAYNLSYTDIYDFASAGNKKSLKKLEIEMGIHHQELGLPWDKPVDESLWDKVADYCENDVRATREAFYYLKGDWLARQILADLADMTVNDTTNSLSQRLIFGKDRNPQGQFNYRNLAEPVGWDRYEEYREKFGPDYKFRVFNAEGLPEYRDYIPGEVLPDGWSILPFFPGYEFKFGKSTYLGEDIGEGGRVYSEPGIHGNVWDGDVTGQHPSSIIAEVLFGVKYTKAFADIVYGRVSIKHQSWSDIDGLFDGKMKPYIQKVINGELTAKELANAFKTVVNSVYGQTKASYPCAFKDSRNKDNIVAKRGALVMTLLKREVQKRGFTVAHIKTDSIKIPDATPEIQQFVLDFGKEYGYSFETEAEFEKFCLVNNAVYIAKTKDGEWTATGKQFAVPYVFKTLFSKEPIIANDLCETFAVKSALYLDMNDNLPDVSAYEKELSKLEDAYKAGKLSDTTFESECARLQPLIDEGHNYTFVGNVGQFTPIKPGNGGGVLLREQNGKYYAATGTTGYRWLESEMVFKKANGTTTVIDPDSGEKREVAKVTEFYDIEDIIDKSYYTKLVDDAVATISQYGDFEWFVSDDPYISPILPTNFMNIPEGAEEEIPWN